MARTLLRRLTRRLEPYVDRITDHPWVQRYAPRLAEPDLWHLNRRSSARAVAIGLFAGLIPGPVQVLGAVGLSLLFRAHFPLAAITTLYTNPVTIVPLYLVAYQYGELFIPGQKIATLHPPEFNMSPEYMMQLIQWMGQLGKPLALGLGLLAITLAALGWITVTLGVALPHGLGVAPPRPAAQRRERLTKPDYWDGATHALSAADPVLAKLIGEYPGLYMTRRSDAFTALCRAIVGQQISVKAADAIWRRLVARADAESADQAFPALSPDRVVRLPPTALREVGLSERKGSYVRDLAEHFVERRLDPAAWAVLDDETLIAALCDVKGIGRWTAEMFLMFHELRPDVFPVDDLGLQKAVAHHFHRGRRVTSTTIRRHGRRWRPWRSVATWYLWRSLDPVAVEY